MGLPSASTHFFTTRQNATQKPNTSTTQTQLPHMHMQPNFIPSNISNINMNRVFDIHQSFQPDNFALLSQQFQRMQAQNTLSSRSSSMQQMQAPNVLSNQNILATSSSNSSTPSLEPVKPVVSTNNGEARPLPNLVAPGRFDVICAR